MSVFAGAGVGGVGAARAGAAGLPFPDGDPERLRDAARRAGAAAGLMRSGGDRQGHARATSPAPADTAAADLEAGRLTGLTGRRSTLAAILATGYLAAVGCGEGPGMKIDWDLSDRHTLDEVTWPKEDLDLDTTNIDSVESVRIRLPAGKVLRIPDRVKRIILYRPGRSSPSTNRCPTTFPRPRPISPPPAGKILRAPMGRSWESNSPTRSTTSVRGA